MKEMGFLGGFCKELYQKHILARCYVAHKIEKGGFAPVFSKNL